MSDSIKQVCHLCIEKLPSCELENIDEKKKEMLKILLININFNISNYAVACKRCLKRLQVNFDFKTHCITRVMEAGNKTDAEKVFPTEIMSRTQNICLDVQVCCLCMSHFIQEKDFNAVADLSTGLLSKDIIRNCLPEMDLNAIQESLICKSCLKSLKELYEFMENCRVVECLYHSSHHSTADMPTAEVFKTKIKFEDCGELGKPVIVKEESYADAKNDVNPMIYLKRDDIASIKCEELHIKEEVCIGEEITNSVPLEACNNSMLSCSLKSKAASKGRKQKKSEGELHKRSGDDRLAKAKQNLTHMRQSEMDMYKCENCEYETRQKDNFNRHMLRMHSDPKAERKFKCDKCSYQSHFNSDLSRHLVKHSDPKAERKFKCDKCSYGTDYKGYLRNHNLIHKDRSKVKMHKCENCEYETRKKDNLIQHMLLNHRDPKADKKFKCDQCPYETDIKASLRAHNLVRHSDPKADRKFKCDQCSYETNIKAHLRRHNLIHKDMSEVEMHKCDNCEFETWKKYNLKKHKLLRHRDPKMERKFKCAKCPYETDLKSYLSRHNVRSHKDKSAMEMHKCENCEYETRRKAHLKQHMLWKHSGDPRAERKFKCDECSYETDIKAYLRAHSMIHKDRSEVEMLKCCNCEYEARQKRSLIQHMLLKHRDPKAEKEFKCDECSYETNIKSYIRKHNLTHKAKSEVEMHRSVT